jgi:predicted TIM-barrel fold metal-dependent hydrolase
MSVIDIHQHTNYSGRSDEELIAHQRTMGITKTVLLPAGSKYGLAVGAGGNDTCVALAKRLPDQFVFFVNELPDIPATRPVLEKYLRMGAIGIGEQKFPVEADSSYINQVAELAHYFGVPMLLHFEYGTYNMGFERFHKVLERYPQVNFIGHAQSWWLNIDKNADPKILYPKGSVKPGGLTDRWLSDYPNMFGDLSAGSGLNAILRDEEHARGFLSRHQDKLLYGSDCSDRIGDGPKCSGSQQLAAIRRLSPSPQATEKMLYGNAARVLKIK